MGPLGIPELLFILVLALLIFGPRKLPEIGRTLGRAMGEFRRATTDLKRTFNTELDAAGEPAPRRPGAADPGASTAAAETISSADSAEGSSDDSGAGSTPAPDSRAAEERSAEEQSAEERSAEEPGASRVDPEALDDREPAAGPRRAPEGTRPRD